MNNNNDRERTDNPAPVEPHTEPRRANATARPKEIGGPAGPEPTRYGDWERNGRSIDF